MAASRPLKLHGRTANAGPSKPRTRVPDRYAPRMVGGELLTVGAEGDGVHPSPALGQAEQLLARGHVPDANGLILAGQGDGSPVGRESEVEHGSRVSPNL